MFFFQAEDGIRDAQESRGLGDVYKRQEETSVLLPLDMLLEEPVPGREVELAEYDLETGRLNPQNETASRRRVFLRSDRVTPPSDEDDGGVCLLYTSDAADDLLCVDLGGRRNTKKKKTQQTLI